jgi:hypothetical protein
MASGRRRGVAWGWRSWRSGRHDHVLTGDAGSRKSHSGGSASTLWPREMREHSSRQRSTSIFSTTPLSCALFLSRCHQKAHVLHVLWWGEHPRCHPSTAPLADQKGTILMCLCLLLLMFSYTTYAFSNFVTCISFLALCWFFLPHEFANSPYILLLIWVVSESWRLKLCC